MKIAISKNKFLSAICAFGLVLILGCAMMLSACGSFILPGELKLAKGAPYGIDIDSTELELTAVDPSTLVTEGDTNTYNYGIKVIGEVDEITDSQFHSTLGFPAGEPAKGYLVVLFTLTITQEMADDEEAVLKLDGVDGILTRSPNLITELNDGINVPPSYGYDGFIVLVLNTQLGGDEITHVGLQWKPEGATVAKTVNYIIDFTGVTAKEAPAA